MPVLASVSIRSKLLLVAINKSNNEDSDSRAKSIM